MDKILTDRESYERLKEEIIELENEVRKLNLNKSLVHKAGTDLAWDSAEFKMLEEDIARINSMISVRKRALNKYVVVENSNNEKVVNLGDIVRLNVMDEYGNDEIIGKLVGIPKYNVEAFYEEISVNSVLGSLIFGRELGEKIAYEVNGVACFVEVLEKLENVKSENKGKTLARRNKK